MTHFEDLSPYEYSGEAGTRPGPRTLDGSVRSITFSSRNQLMRFLDCCGISVRSLLLWHAVDTSVSSVQMHVCILPNVMDSLSF